MPYHSTYLPPSVKTKRPAPKHTPTGFRILATLAGAAPGLYIMFTFPHEPAAYAGPFVSLSCLIAAKAVCRMLYEWARGRGATHHEPVKYPYADSD